MRQVAKILMVALFATAVWTSSANAAPEFFNVDLVLIGSQGAGESVVNLTDKFGSFTDLWFKVDAAISREALAIALTALSTNRPIVVFADPVSVPDPLIFKIFVAP